MNRTRQWPRAGMIVPALLLAGLPAVVPASVPPSPVPKPGTQPRMGEAPKASPLEAAAARAAARLRGEGDRLPADADAVEFALLLYAESGRQADLRLAASLAERTPEETGPVPLYRVAAAGGPTLAAAEARRRASPDAPEVPGIDTASAAGWALALFARAAVVPDPGAVEEALLGSAAVLDSRLQPAGSRLGVVDADGSPAGLESMVRTLGVMLGAADLSGSPEIREDAGKVARELVRRFWDEESTSFGSGPEAPDLALQCRAARMLWEVGYLGGDRFLTGRAGRVLEALRDRALRDPRAVASFGLAAARVSRHPVQMVLLGPAADPVLTELRRASFSLFEPRRVLLSLDPHADRDRIQELAYPPELAPVLFVCVESICSAPIHTAAGLEKKVKEIVALAAGVQE